MSKTTLTATRPARKLSMDDVSFINKLTPISAAVRILEASGFDVVGHLLDADLVKLDEAGWAHQDTRLTMFDAATKAIAETFNLETV
jgi:hypothetical protein